jgi:hypothetical protein
MDIKYSNFICFLPRETCNIMTSKTISTIDFLEKALQAQLLIDDGYNKILEFHSSGSLIIVAGLKSGDKQKEAMKKFEEMLKTFGGNNSR